MKPIELYREIKAKFIESGKDSPETDARVILEKCLNIKREDIILGAEVDISDMALANIEDMVRRRIGGEPLSKILGLREFWGLEFEVTVDTLDPRPDSETLIEVALKYVVDPMAPLRILDIGTGTGCLAISLLSGLPNASGVAIDISAAALEVAGRNVKRHGMEDRLTLSQQGWQEVGTDCLFDIVISNPPYISILERKDLSVEVKEFDPHLALFAGEDGLEAYRGIAERLSALLNPDEGFAIFEIGMSQAKEVSEIFEKSGFKTEALYQDLAGRDRCLIVKPAPTLKKS